MVCKCHKQLGIEDCRCSWWKANRRHLGDGFLVIRDYGGEPRPLWFTHWAHPGPFSVEQWGSHEPERELSAWPDLCKGDRQRDGEGITIAVTPIKTELISSGITQPSSIQFSVMRNQGEEEREGENENTNTCTYQEEVRQQKAKTAGFQRWVDLSFASKNSTQGGRWLCPSPFGVQHIIYCRFWHLT